MSYYQKSKFSVSDHAIARAKQRIPEYSNLDNFDVKTEIINYLYKHSFPEFSDFKCDYYLYSKLPNKYLYIIVDKKTNLVISITPISHNKKISIFS